MNSRPAGRTTGHWETPVDTTPQWSKMNFSRESQGQFPAEHPLATQWYYAIDGSQQGPVSPKELKKLAERGELKPDDLVWKEGMAEWVAVSQVKGLTPPDTAATVAAAAPAVASPRPTAPAAAVAAPEPAPDVVDDEPATYSTSRRRRRNTRNIAGPLVLILAAMPMIACIFVPWWSFRLKPHDTEKSEDVKGKWAKSAAQAMTASPRQVDSSLKMLEKLRDSLRDSTDENAAEQRQQVSDMISFVRIVKRNSKWWERHLKSGDDDFEDRIDEVAEEVDKDDKLSMSMTIWGWHTGSGIMAVAFGSVILVLGIVFIAVPVLRNFSWTVSAVATVMGIIALVFSLLWIFQAPNKDVGEVFSQGIIIGPWLFLGAGSLYFVTGLFDTIFGIAFLARRVR